MGWTEGAGSEDSRNGWEAAGSEAVPGAKDKKTVAERPINMIIARFHREEKIFKGTLRSANIALPP
jgi:hypothetical protein